jgi:hypothetical protein
MLEPVQAERSMSPELTNKPIQQEILDVLGALRAEALGDQVFQFFAEPAFFPRLQSRNSMVLKGGRGTGKTTLLRCLSYQGQSALRIDGPGDWPFFGFFWRINTNRVAAFAGPELSDQRWTKLFGHYVNLELTELLLEFVGWLNAHGAQCELGAAAFDELSASLNIEASHSLEELRRRLNRGRIQFQARLNNIADSDSNLGLSLLGAPVDLLVAHLHRHALFTGKKLFFLIDEYENLLDYQQEVFNTLIKHSSAAYSFKIGVREMGFRRHATINPHEQLSSPADYDVIGIAEELAPRFDAFAERLVASRLEQVTRQHKLPLLSVRMLFETLSPDEEALRLGVGDRNREFRQLTQLTNAQREKFDKLTPLQQYFVAVWSRASTMPAYDAIEGLASRDRAWIRRYGNYSFALLFAIRAGKPGRHKLYAGWHTICRLANTNVRYLLELVSGMLQQHIADGKQLNDQVSAELQTDHSYEVGRKNLQELERESDQAASLVKLVLGLGRVFEVLAASPAGHTPEVTQFVLPSAVDVGLGLGDIERRVKELLDDAVNSLALVRFPGSKLQQRSSVRSYDYSLHPIYTALFGFSYRRKRKLEINEEEFLALVSEPRWAINRILLRQNRDPSAVPIPDQLRLFASFYD